MKIVKCFSRVSFSFHSRLAAASRARKTLENNNLRSSAMKELVWLLALVIPSVWSDDGFLTEPRKCQVDCAPLISKLGSLEAAESLNDCGRCFAVGLSDNISLQIVNTYKHTYSYLYTILV